LVEYATAIEGNFHLPFKHFNSPSFHSNILGTDSKNSFRLYGMPRNINPLQPNQLILSSFNYLRFIPEYLTIASQAIKVKPQNQKKYKMSIYTYFKEGSSEGRKLGEKISMVALKWIWGLEKKPYDILAAVLF